jgi:hypothetical protein
MMVDTNSGPEEYTLVDEETFHSYQQQICLPVGSQLFYTDTPGTAGTLCADDTPSPSLAEEGNSQGGS